MSRYGYTVKVLLDSTNSKFVDWMADQESEETEEYLARILREKIEEECDKHYNEFYRATDGY